MESWEILLRLLLATGLGALIGLEREKSNRPAGLRTHILVTVGSALIMLISANADVLISGPRSADPARLAAQVVSGIGFLGAGTIFKSGNTVTGLTTAAGLWVCGGIGLAIGAGYYLGGISVAIISIVSLSFLGNLEKSLPSKSRYLIKLECAWREGLAKEVAACLGERKKVLLSMRTDQPSNKDERESRVRMEMEVVVHGAADFEAISKRLLNLSGVEHLEWERCLTELV